jgi:PAS domain S-box-containing protein
VHKAFEIALRDSEERLQMALSGADMAVWDWHIPSGALVFNARWAEMLGYTLEELPPRIESWETRVNPDDMPEVKDRLTSHFKGETPIYISEHRVRHRDGHWVWIQGRGKANGWDDAGNPIHAVGIALDISERKDIEQKLVRAYAELEQFANISAHHLQEPARRLVSFVQRLKASLAAEQLSEDATVSMNFIERSATRQLALVQDIQLYLAAAQPRGPTDKISPSDIITHLLEQRSTLIYETGAQVGFNCLYCVTIDRPRLKDIFGILLDNALQYCHPRMTPQIRIDSELKAGRVIFRFADNGIGIPAEYRERVLGVFERLQVSEDQNSTGIGLSIVRRIVESCGGSVSLHETLGGGVTVLFDLPGSPKNNV